ncbi:MULTISPECIES: hypothetical protein [Catenuloplanes]|uniref:Uncharacterized protein n=1 Tax=Catenuloplanes niger TaxID=587534 RepID=A0AAE4A1E0_9ACTN|nr:hypothetical protein [Catenuloplanes niger]MDR7327465.1 hypothetical protein [Catenuloplanes niger]
MSDAEKIIYDEFPDAIRRVRAALADRETMDEAVPLALQLLEHGWTSGSQETLVGLAWDRLGLGAGMSASLLFPEAYDYTLLVTPRVDDAALLNEGRDLALAAADALDVLCAEAGQQDDRRRVMVSTAAALRAAARWPE